MVSVGSLVQLCGRIQMDNLNAEKRYTPLGAYAQSKLATLVLSQILNQKLQQKASRTIAVAAHPGITQSGLARHNAFLTAVMPFVGQPAAKGALSLLVAAAGSGVRGGDFIGPRGFLTMRGAPHAAWARPLTRNLAVGEQLWGAAEELTGYRYL